LTREFRAAAHGSRRLASDVIQDGIAFGSSTARRRAAIAAAVVAALSGAAASYLAVKRAGEESRARRVVSSTSRRGRSLQLALVGTRAGRAYAWHRARRVFADAGERQRLDEEYGLRTAEQVADALGHMKGALMKIGQMASYLDQGLPEPVREALAQLQQNAPPMDPELAASVVERELGARPETLFAEWDPVPIASASIGQVHRAITRDGLAVAVKVQYPGVDEAIRADLDNGDMVMTALGMMLPGLDAAPIAREIRERVGEELDYENEAANQRLFAAYYDDHPFIHVPRVVDGLSSRRVLTTELAAGARFDELLTWTQIERDMAAEAIYRFVFRSLYRLHIFNGDPHPGNYLFEPGGHVTFLDFGLVKHFASEDIDKLAAMVQAIVIDRDIAAFRTAVERAGFVADTSAFSDDELIAYLGHFYEFILDDEPRTITPEWSSESLRRFFDMGSEHGDMIRAANVPASFVILQRINLGLFAVLGELHATANWRRVAEELWPWVAGPPSSSLGEAEARWMATQQQT
jgi:predicted unusual protein kinase regulating ubiquinone biosynthesis (AarF/ABC1/UbiB family)